ncbi:MAG: LemA family protein [Minwuiales bacterium]|nr:LemA family protein [Minwuiales bacterium]
MRAFIRLWVLLLLPLWLSACGVNDIPTYDEQTTAAWAQVENQYQRRADLIPNLVETVKGFAAQERETLTAVVEARARVGQMQIPKDLLTDPEAFRRFQQNQDTLTQALSRLMVVVERYPQLRSSENFLTLQAQLEGTENRLAVARRDYIEAVRLFNTELRTLPGRFWHSLLYSDLQPKQTFAAADGTSTVPQVKFQ